MVSDAKGIPLEIGPGKKIKGSEKIDLATTQNVKWVAKSRATARPPSAVARC